MDFRFRSETFGRVHESRFCNFISKLQNWCTMFPKTIPFWNTGCWEENCHFRFFIDTCRTSWDKEINFCLRFRLTRSPCIKENYTFLEPSTGVMLRVRGSPTVIPLNFYVTEEIQILGNNWILHWKHWSCRVLPVLFRLVGNNPKWTVILAQINN